MHKELSRWYFHEEAFQQIKWHFKNQNVHLFNFYVQYNQCGLNYFKTIETDFSEIFTHFVIIFLTKFILKI